MLASPRCVGPHHLVSLEIYIRRPWPLLCFELNLHTIGIPPSSQPCFITAQMHNRMAAGWFYSPTQIYNYILSRPATLKPPRSRLRNPVSVLKELDRHQWLMFLGGFLGWTWDAFDFFTVSLTVTEIAKEFGVRNSDVTWVSIRPRLCGKVA
jgi:hypothetical protein